MDAPKFFDARNGATGRPPVAAGLAALALTLATCEAPISSTELTDADCLTTYWCVDKGRCKAKGGNCVADSAQGCLDSAECKTHNRCQLIGNVCGTNPFGPCVDLELCKKRGYCRSEGELCCNDDGWCCDTSGNCKAN